MAHFEVRQHLTPDDIAAIDALALAATRVDDRQALDDLHSLALRDGHPGRVSVVGHLEAGALVGYAQAVPIHDGWSLELVVDPDHRVGSDAVRPGLLGAALDAIRAAGGGTVHWWLGAATPDEVALAGDAGFVPGRVLHQMRVALPLAETTAVPTRAFRPGQDEEAWLEVNNRAFADHPEQGGWDLATLLAREQEDWFDPEGFLLHEADGRLAGFCWTKLHQHEQPVLGEIYVIGVDPSAGGRGLGRAMVLAGLTSIAGRGVRVGMLYVDDANPAAMHLYATLDFVVHRTDRAFTAKL